MQLLDDFVSSCRLLGEVVSLEVFEGESRSSKMKFLKFFEYNLRVFFLYFIRFSLVLFVIILCWRIV